jgi:hypothetical protein
MQCWDRNIHRAFRRRQEEGACEASMGGKGMEGCVPFAYDTVLMEEHEAEALTGTKHEKRVLFPALLITQYPPPSFAPCLAPSYCLDGPC